MKSNKHIRSAILAGLLILTAVSTALLLVAVIEPLIIMSSKKLVASTYIEIIKPEIFSTLISITVFIHTIYAFINSHMENKYLGIPKQRLLKHGPVSRYMTAFRVASVIWAICFCVTYFYVDNEAQHTEIIEAIEQSSMIPVFVKNSWFVFLIMQVITVCILTFLSIAILSEWYCRKWLKTAIKKEMRQWKTDYKVKNELFNAAVNVKDDYKKSVLYILISHAQEHTEALDFLIELLNEFIQELLEYEKADKETKYDEDYRDLFFLTIFQSIQLLYQTKEKNSEKTGYLVRGLQQIRSKVDVLLTRVSNETADQSIEFKWWISINSAFFWGSYLSDPERIHSLFLKREYPVQKEPDEVRTGDDVYGYIRAPYFNYLLYITYNQVLIYAALKGDIVLNGDIVNFDVLADDMASVARQYRMDKIHFIQKNDFVLLNEKVGNLMNIISKCYAVENLQQDIMKALKEDLNFMIQGKPYGKSYAGRMFKMIKKAGYTWREQM